MRRKLLRMAVYLLMAGIPALSLLPGFSKAPRAVPSTPLPSLAMFDQPYGHDPLQRYDLFLPAGRTAGTGVVILLHGGAWVTGDKSYCNGYANHFANAGFAAVSMNYRLAGDSVHCAEMLADIASMISTAGKNAAGWNVAGNRVSLFGYSAGGHLALLYGYSSDIEKKVRSVISLAGVTDVTDSLLLNGNGLLDDIILMAGDGQPVNWAPVNPVSFVKNTDPPTLFIHGTGDPLVPYTQSTGLYGKLQLCGASARMLLLENETHIFTEDATSVFLDESTRFLKETLK